MHLCGFIMKYIQKIVRIINFLVIENVRGQCFRLGGCLEQTPYPTGSEQCDVHK